MSAMEVRLLQAIRGDTPQEVLLFPQLMEENDALQKEVEMLKAQLAASGQTGQTATAPAAEPVSSFTEKFEHALEDAAPALAPVTGVTKPAPTPAPAPAPAAAAAPAPAPVPAAAAAPPSRPSFVPSNATAEDDDTEPTIVTPPMENWEPLPDVKSAAGTQVEKSVKEYYGKVRRDRFKLRWVMFGFDEDGHWIIPLATMKKTSDIKEDWETFLENLPDSNALFAVYAFDYIETNGAYSDQDSQITKSKLAMFVYTPKTCPTKSKMLVASSCSVMQTVCSGVLDATIMDKDDCDWDSAAEMLGIDL